MIHKNLIIWWKNLKLSHYNHKSITSLNNFVNLKYISSSDSKNVNKILLSFKYLMLYLKESISIFKWVLLVNKAKSNYLSNQLCLSIKWRNFNIFYLIAYLKNTNNSNKNLIEKLSFLMETYILDFVKSYIEIFNKPLLK